MNTLYFLSLNDALYWSTNVTEINDFAKTWGMIGQVEASKEVTFEIPTVICIHQFGSL